MTETKNNDERFPEVKPTKPGNDTAYIAPIIGKLGYDTRRPWLFGLGTSPNNGVDFHVFLSFDGLNFDDNDIDKIWNGGTADRVKKEVDSATAEIPAAVSAANSAVSAAESAVAASKVNSDAIVAQSEAISEAKSGADQAIKDAQAAIKSVASDAAAIKQNVANVESQVASAQSANAAAVQQLNNDLSTAKQSIATANDNLAKAQSAIDDNKKAIASNVASITAAIAQHRQDIAAAQAANAKTATELASYTKQAEAQGKTIKDIQSDADSTKLTIADIKGNVTQAQQSVTALQGSLKDTNGNVATVKAQADAIQSALTDYKKNVATLSATADSLKASLKDADGRLSTVEQTAKDQATTISDLKGNFTQVKQEADKLTDTMKDAQGDITQIQATAKGLSQQIESAQGDISNLTKTASSLQASLADHRKRIATVEARADKLESDMKDAQGNITTAMQTASAASVTASDAKSNAATAVVTASGAKTAAEDAKSNAAEAQLTASAAGVTAKDAKSDVMTVTATASDAKALATNANSQAAEAKFAADNFSVKLSGVEKSVTSAANQASTATSTANQANAAAGKAQSTANQANTNAGAAQSAAGKAQATADSNAKQISSVATTVSTVQTSLKATQTELSGKADKATVDATNNRLNDTNAQVKIIAGEISSKAEQTTVTNLSNTVNSIKGSIDWKTVTGPFDANTYKTTQRIFYRDTQAKNTPNTGWFYFKVDAGASDRITQTLTRDNATDTWTRVWNGSWSAWTKQATGNDISNLQAQVTKQSTEISNNTKAINLKADSQTVDTVKHTVEQQQAQQQIMADQIKTKVTSSDVQGILANGHYATQSYTQSIVNQTSQTLNSNITEVKRTADSNHQADVNRMTNLQQSIDGIQGVVKNKADQSTVTQLANTFQSKISGAQGAIDDLKSKAEWTEKDDIDFNNCKTQMNIFTKSETNAPNKNYWWYLRVEPGISGRVTQYAVSDRDNHHYTRQFIDPNWTPWVEDASESEITQLRDDINLRVKKGDLLSQINMTADNTLIQSGKIYLAADSTIFGGRAFIPSAAIVNLDASKITFYGAGNTYATMGAGVKQFDDDKQKSTINLQYQGGVEMHTSNELGSILTMHDQSIRLAVKSNGMAHSGPTNQYSGFYAGKQYSLINSYMDDGTTAGVSIGSTTDGTNKDYRIMMYDQSQGHGSLSWGVGVNTSRFDVYAGDAGVYAGPDVLHLKNEKSHLNLELRSDSVTGDSEAQVAVYIDGQYNTNNYGVHLNLWGWMDMTGWLTCKGVTQTSLLSAKTRIQPLDTAYALQKINEADVETYLFKSDVAHGKTKRHTSVILDDVHDVAQYNTPEEFISENRKGRDDGDIIGFLMGAVQELTKQVNKLKKEVKDNG